MTLEAFFRHVVSELGKREARFAIAGGLVASVYRQAPRATRDLDVLVFLDKGTPEALLRSFGLEPHPLRQAELEGGPMFLMAGRPSGSSPGGIGLDLILPAIPWAGTAIVRAQDNRIDFGFGPVPCLTVEDLVLSKLYALRNQSTRFMDLDDLRSIFESRASLDLAYLCGRVSELGLPVPEALRSVAPKALLSAARARKR